ncbi:hypothetical protein EA187_14905 [Lujinxingia sediminis]|uniref:RES domain-containing protein n=1 Tax=Lujinxingia sediminis TaxID=2480984 RepID=A0ABY0CQL6_9DELT|nr:hypothetical protein [Lujinxingia sediminis]RVU42796.1 hypothetical protein EA187_14905 [Lujinxingia sediminis]
MTDLYDFSTDAMVEPIERLFEREFPSTFDLFNDDPKLSDEGPRSVPVDVVYVAGSVQKLHAIKLASSYDDCLFDVRSGLHAMSRATANYRWLALPLEALREGEAEYNDILLKTAGERGVGIITVQPRGRGLSAKIVVNANYEEGDFLDHYQGMRDHYRSSKERDVAAEGFQVVDYYGR